MKYNDLIDILEEIAPTEYYEDEDNSGIQIHDGKEEIRKVLVCLEVNDDVMAEARKKGADMIITHHPLLFYPLSKIEPHNPAARYVMEAIKADIDIYSSHLPFDAAARGNNMYLAELLKLQDVAMPDTWDESDYGYELDKEYNRKFKKENDDITLKASFGAGAPKLRYTVDDDFEYDEDEIGSIGFLPRTMNFKEFQTYVERCLDLPLHYVRCVDGGKSEIRKVAFCTGAGGDFIYIAAKEGCDAYITGDLKLHEAQYAKAVGLTVIDAGHYGTEKIFTENMAAQLRAKAGESLEVMEAESNTNPYTL